uniref:Uncharacterized protein n=1 Tax=Caenorhabditis japonica TaxID=281687 RepID=A0A8R1DUL8_CAEJA
MEQFRHTKEHPSTSTQVITFDIVALEELYGILRLQSCREDYFYTEIRGFYNIPDEKELVVNIRVKNPNQNPDFAWDRRVKYLYRYMLDLEKFMWNLSTLGGAYSAMGDFDKNYAKIAAKITAQQISLAKKYGDPNILARCLLYTALAEGQMGRLTQAVLIVRAVKHWAKQNRNSEIVERCCEGVYQKLRAIRLFGK